MTYTIDTSTTFISVLSLKKLNGKQYDLEMKSSLYSPSSFLQSSSSKGD